MGDNDAETLANVTTAEWDFDDPVFEDISQEAREFIQDLLVKAQTYVIWPNFNLLLRPSINESIHPLIYPIINLPNHSFIHRFFHSLILLITCQFFILVALIVFFHILIDGLSY